MGERIKKTREKKGMNLSELASKVGVSSSCLSQIENIKSFPSIFTLKKIADILNTTVGNLIGENEKLIDNPLLKKSEKKFVEKISKGINLYLLSHHDPNKEMETYFVRFAKNSVSHNFIEKHPGQAFIYLLTGKLEMVLNDKKYILAQGSSFYIKSKGLTVIKNLHKSVSEIIWIIK